VTRDLEKKADKIKLNLKIKIFKTDNKYFPHKHMYMIKKGVRFSMTSSLLEETPLHKV